ncbi:protein O-mannosyl-transferase TMTC3-like [Anneissia japonica]|uniref:protein O-mannosyl-transferase TMTC3-like n=1 Tax=Anneissia japonica TaxID=1529436 RepID=UPI0014258444|nr:protein O-mannosyl-transferase TMTC3-like [Anneissia japonica]
MEKNTFHIYSAILVALVTICYHNALQCGFVFDDISAIKENKDLRPSSPLSNLMWNDFWGTPMHKEGSHKSYRPICVLTFRINYGLGELDPVGYHLVNVILHAVVSVMFLKMCTQFFSDTTSFIASLLFALHPIHTEAVTGVVGRAELLASIFLLQAFKNYIECTGKDRPIDWFHLVMTMVFVSLATMCKEQGITVVGVCCVYEVFVAQKLSCMDLLQNARSWLSGKVAFPGALKLSFYRILFLAFGTFLLLYARLQIMGSTLPVFTNFDNPASQASYPARHLTYWYLLPINAWLLLCPSKLCCDWTMGTIPLVESFHDPRNLATVLFIFILGSLVLYVVVNSNHLSKQVIMCLAFLVLPFIPASNLFFPVGFVVAERILYMPSMGFCMLVALAFQLVNENFGAKRQVFAVLSLLLLAYGSKTFRRNYDWQSEYTLFASGLKVNTQNAKLWNNVGHSLESEERHEEALHYFLQASRVQPDDTGAWINVGRAYKNIQEYEKAEDAYRHAITLMPTVVPGKMYTTRIAPSYLNAYINLANLIKNNNTRLEEADTLFQRVITMRPDLTTAYINRGDVLLRLNRSFDAEQSFRTALEHDHDNADIHYNLGVIYLDRGELREAFQYFNKALELNPDHMQALFNTAVTMQESRNPGLRTEATRRLKKVLAQDPHNAKAFFNLAALSMDSGETDQAEMLFKKALEIEPLFRGALFNIALLYSNNNRSREAIPYLQTLLQAYPRHTKSWILLGDIYINTLKQVPEAKLCFQKTVEIDPNNIQGQHNLCVIYVEEGNLEMAKKCLEKVVRMAPGERYIRKHLEIVRNRIEKQERMKLQNKQINDEKLNNSNRYGAK